MLLGQVWGQKSESGGKMMDEDGSRTLSGYGRQLYFK